MPHSTTDMNFWTPERCKTLSTEVLIDNMGDFLKQAQATKNQEFQARSIYLAQIIDAELRTRF